MLRIIVGGNPLAKFSVKRSHQTAFDDLFISMAIVELFDGFS